MDYIKNYIKSSMANTSDLLGLIDEFSSAFADPEFPVEERSQPSSLPNVEPKEACTDGEIEDTDDCDFSLFQIREDPDLMLIASSFLSELAKVANLKKHLRNEPVRQALQKIVDDGKLDKMLETSETLGKISDIKIDVGLHLPETHARQGTPECPGGLCSL